MMAIELATKGTAGAPGSASNRAEQSRATAKLLYFLQHVEKLQDTELHTQSCFLYMPCQKGDTHLTARPTGLQPDNRHSLCAAVTTSLLNSHPMRPFITDLVH